MPSDFQFLSGIASHCIDTLANWELHNPVIPEGVLCIEKSGVDTIKIKIGDGVKTYTQLNYFAAGGSTVLATELVDGLLAKEDFVKLANIEEYANNYIHPSTHPASIITEDAAHQFVTDEEKAAWSAKQIALGFTPENLANKNAANGYAGLDANGYFQGNSASANSILAPMYVAGEALAANDLIFLAEDNKWYKALTVGASIPTGAILARCNAANAEAVVTAYIVGVGTLPTSITGVEGKDLYIRGELVDGVFVSSGTVSAQLDPGYSYVRFGSCILNTTTCHYDGNNQIYTIDDNANLVALDDTIIGNSGLVQIKKYSTTLADGATVINLPWLYNPLTKNVMVFLGQVYQDDSTLQFTDSSTITLTSPVVGSTPVTVIATFSLDQTHTISRHKGTLLADTKTINLPWAYDVNDQNILVFLGSTYQHVDSLNYVDNTTIELDDVVDEDTPFEVIRTMSLDNKTEMIGKYNYIINGNFEVWLRGNAQTTTGYGSDDRWSNNNVGTTKTHSKQSFTVGEVFPDGTPTPKFYSRTVVNSVVGAGNYCQKRTNIEFVSTLAGKKAVLSFYAKADANKKMGIQLAQIFGTGGSPSTTVEIGVQYVDLTVTWKRFVLIFDIPLITGKTLGSDNNDSLRLNFWFDAGTTYSSLSGLGQQSGTFDISSVTLIEGDKDINPIPRSYDENAELCSRFCELVVGSIGFDATKVGGVATTVVNFKTKRTFPICSLIGSTPTQNNVSSEQVMVLRDNCLRYAIYAAAIGTAYVNDRLILVDAEL